MSADVDALPEMLARLKLTAMRDRLDGLLDEAARGNLSLRETLQAVRKLETGFRPKGRRGRIRAWDTLRDTLREQELLTAAEGSNPDGPRRMDTAGIRGP